MKSNSITKDSYRFE